MVTGVGCIGVVTQPASRFDYYRYCVDFLKINIKHPSCVVFVN